MKKRFLILFAVVAALLAIPASLAMAQTVGENNDVDTNSCEFRLTENVLSFALCPVIEGATRLAQNFDNAITQELSIDTGNNSFFDENAPNVNGEPSAGQRFYQIWSVMRFISMGLLIVIALVMVISQALSISVFDAYTIRKVLPRLVAAVIFVSLSWQICKLMIEIANGFGYGVRALIYAPFGGASQVEGNIFSIGNGEALIGSTGLIAAFIGLGALGILSFALTAAMAAMIGFLVIIFRKIIIIMLVLFAPLAIILAILPNTQKMWKLWWDSFSKALIMFPLLMAFIAGGRVVAKATELTPTANEGVVAGLLQQVVSFIAYFGPYFALPAAFRLAGGAVATIGGLTNDRSRGAFDRLKQGRNARMKDRYSRAGSASLWNPNTRRGKIGNKLASIAVRPDQAAAYHGRNVAGIRRLPGIAGTGNKIASQLTAETLEETGKLSQEMQQFGFNDRALKAVGGMHESLSDPVKGALKSKGLLGKELQSLDDIQAAAGIMAANGTDTEKIGANAMLASAGRLASLYSDNDMTHASIAGASAMELSRQGFADGSDLASVGNHLRDHMGDQGAQAIVTRAQLMGQQARPDLKAGYGVMFDAETGFRDGTAPGSERSAQLLGTIKQSDWLGAKSASVEKLSAPIAQMANETMPLLDKEGKVVKDAEGKIVDYDIVPEVVRDNAGVERRDSNGEVIMQQVKRTRYTTQAKAMRDMIALGASQYSSSDTSAKVEWRKLSKATGLDSQVQQVDNYQRAQQERTVAGASPGGGEGGDAGPAAPAGDGGGGGA